MRTLALGFLALFAWTACPTAATQQVGAGERTRIVNRPSGESIPSLVRPSDEVVIVKELYAPPPLVTTSTGDSRYELNVMSRPQNALLLVRAESVESTFDQSESWLSSTVTLRVLDVLRKGNQRLNGDFGSVRMDDQRNTITLKIDGGHTRVGKTLVTAGDYSVWELHKRYLVCLQIVPEEGTYFSIVYLVGPNRELIAQPRSLGSDMTNPSALSGLQLDDVLSKLK